MNECKRNIKFLARYADGNLPLKRMKTVEAHLLHCEHCRLIYEKAQSAFDLLDMHKRVEPSPYFTAKVTNALRTEDNPPEILSWLLSFVFSKQNKLVFFILVSAGIWVGLHVYSQEKVIQDSRLDIYAEFLNLDTQLQNDFIFLLNN